MVLGRSDVLAVPDFEKGIVPPVPERIANVLTGKLGKISDIVDTDDISTEIDREERLTAWINSHVTFAARFSSGEKHT